MFTPQTLLNVFFFFFPSNQTVKTKKCNRLLPKTAQCWTAHSNRGLRQPGRTRSIMVPYHSWCAKQQRKSRSQAQGGQPLDPNTCILQCWYKSLCHNHVQHSGRTAEHGHVQSTYPKVSSSAEGNGLSCTTEQQQGVAQLPQCLDRVASSHNMLVLYWESLFLFLKM